MECVQSNYGDITKYYQGSYIKLREFGDALFYVVKVSRDEVLLKDKNDNEFVITLHDSVPYNIDMILPNKSLFQHNNHCFSLSRVPARQYHRGITRQNCEVQVLGEKKWGTAAVGFDTLEGYVNKPLFPTLSDAIADKSVSAALSRRFAYSRDGTLWCDLRKIGTVDKLSKVVSVNSLLQLEVSKLLSDTRVSTNFLIKGY